MALPRFSDDDFLNYCVTEALMFRAQIEEVNAEKEREIKEWKSQPLGGNR